MSLPEFLTTKEYLSWLIENLSVDHDNTISDTKGIVATKFNQEFKTDHQTSEINRYRSLADWCLSLGMNEDEALAVNHRYWYDQKLINQAEPKSGAVEFLKKANRVGRLIINSSRPFEQRESTITWYKEHMPFIKPEQIVVGLPDVVIPGDAFSQAVSKVWVVRLFGCRAHVEDVVSHAKLILDHTNAFVFLLSDDASLDRRYQTRLMRFGGIGNQPPGMTMLNQLFFP